MVKFMTADEAVKLISPGDTLAISGFVGMGHPAEITKAIEKSFLESGKPNNLNLTFAASHGDGKNFDTCLNVLAKEGLIKKTVAGHYGLSPAIVKMVTDNKIEAYNLPQGVLLHLLRAIGGRKPGIITKIGLKTFVDPRETGGKLNDISQEEYVKLVEIDEKEYLFYKSFPVNVAIVRGTTADENGNITIEKEAIALEFLTMAIAAKASGGRVIVEVERVTKAGTLNPMLVKVPGVLVDAVVVAKPENHWQVPKVSEYDPSLCGEIRKPLQGVKAMALDERKIISRRCAMELVPGATINLGIGMPEGVGAVAAEEGINESLTMTVEPGVIGGVPLSGLCFGTAMNPQAMIDHPYMFDFYDAGGLDLTVLGMAQMDQYGNVNVSKFGPKIAGAGGFINITQSTKVVVFCGTLTAGSEVKVKDGKLEIIKEGKIKKLVEKVEHITFSGEYGKSSGQKIMYVTERAVFALTPDGVVLTEIAPGVDLEKDVLAQMNFKPIVSSDLKLMDARIFGEMAMGIKEEILAKDNGSNA